jgi:hypothetical protein
MAKIVRKNTHHNAESLTGYNGSPGPWRSPEQSGRYGQLGASTADQTADSPPCTGIGIDLLSYKTMLVNLNIYNEKE